MTDAVMPIMKGRVAIVTGAGKGLGKAYAKWLADRGCAVVVNNRIHSGVPSSAQALVDEIVAAGGLAIAHEGPIDEAASAEALVQTAITHYGKLDILICNAGVMPEAPFMEMGLDEIKRAIDGNIWGTIYPLKAAWPHMLKQGYGRVVVSGSTVGMYGHGGVAVYGATKSAMLGLARSLALEVPPGSDIGINVILPLAYTPMSAKSMDENRGADMSNTLPPEKVAPVVGWLCSEACKLNGDIFHAGGGRTSRVAIVESRSIAVESMSMEAVSSLSFEESIASEPRGAGQSSGRMLGG